jgi:hypothetical protein
MLARPQGTALKGLVLTIAFFVYRRFVFVVQYRA